MIKISEILTYLLIAAVTIIFLLVAIPKIIFPYEASYMEGSMLEAISRVLIGMPVYVKPNIHYLTWLYQPLYYFITAAITSITGLTFVTARIPSILSTIGLCWILYAVVKKETGRFYYAISAVALFIAAYPKTEYCLVMARLDPLFTLFLISAVVLTYYSRSNTGLICGALLLALSYFTKQTGLVFAPVIIFYLWYLRGWRPMLVFLITLTTIVLCGTYIFDALSNGWYSYYTILIPRGKGSTLRLGYAISGLFLYIFLRCWGVSIILSLSSSKNIFSKSKKTPDRASVYFGVIFIAAIIAGFLGILNNGGGHNVLLPASAICGFFLPLIVSELIDHHRFGRLSLWLIPIQLAFLTSFPWLEPFNITRDVTKKRQEEYFRYAASLPGNVWIPFHGYTQNFTGKEEAAEINEMRDVFLVNDTAARQLHNELDSAFLKKHWSWIVSDFNDTFPHYKFIATIPNQYKLYRADTILCYLYKPEK